MNERGELRENGPSLWVELPMCGGDIETAMQETFNLDDLTWDALWLLARGILGGDRNWCDSFIYEVILYPMVDILDSKEACIQIIDGFVRSNNGKVVASTILDLDLGGYTSVLDV